MYIAAFVVFNCRTYRNTSLRLELVALNIRFFCIYRNYGIFIKCNIIRSYNIDSESIKWEYNIVSKCNFVALSNVNSLIFAMMSNWIRNLTRSILVPFKPDCRFIYTLRAIKDFNIIKNCWGYLRLVTCYNLASPRVKAIFTYNSNVSWDKENFTSHVNLIEIRSSRLSLTKVIIFEWVL